MVIQAMIPDTIQAYETFSGRRDEGFLSSLCLFVTKIGSALAALIVSLSFGYAEKSIKLSEETAFLYRIVCFGVPACGLLIGAIVMFFAADYSKPENFTFPFTAPPEDSDDVDFDVPQSHRVM